ncbi:sugar kinase [Staphylococcus haemolyticus]|uniref:sugar kinase n=1 Tax=Staphylococcus haemolyticus TaxID=1283 RepID=UPI001F0A66B8|nr:sugar kinase [Staphylococcus haemolyticus]MCH4460401.1 sugar kinase [Staphylococcus haemolyticus]MCH4484155.1 sugar kinase [Staphylococcus haemolyticus]
MSFITFGEILMRLSTPHHQTFEQSQAFDVHYGGAEMNVAIGLSGLGINTTMITALPNNDLGESIVQNLRRYNVNADHIKKASGRLGLYFTESGYAQRSNRLIYDRNMSVFSQFNNEDYQIEQLLKHHEWFHITGITAALNDELFTFLKKAVKKAKELDLFVSCDLNFRDALWDFQTARRKMSELLYDVDLIFGYEPLSLPDGSGNDEKDGLDRVADIEEIKPFLAKIHQTYDISYIAFTQRKIFNHKRNRLQGFLSTPNQLAQTEKVDVDILDRLGTGDAFSVGIIYGIMKQWHLEDTVQFGINNMIYKHNVIGDYSYANIEKINTSIESNKDINR